VLDLHPRTAPTTAEADGAPRLFGLPPGSRDARAAVGRARHFSSLDPAAVPMATC
jgi:hypothetical protein